MKCICRIGVFYILSLEQDRARCFFVQAQDRTGKGRFAAARFPDQADGLPGMNRKGHVMDSSQYGPGTAEPVGAYDKLFCQMMDINESHGTPPVPDRATSRPLYVPFPVHTPVAPYGRICAWHENSAGKTGSPSAYGISPAPDRQCL